MGRNVSFSQSYFIAHWSRDAPLPALRYTLGDESATLPAELFGLLFGESGACVFPYKS